MRKLLLILTAFISVSVQAQFIRPNNSYGTMSNRQSVDSTLFIPTGNGTPSLRGIDLNKMALYGDSTDNLIHLYNPKTKTWGPITGNGYNSAASLDSSMYSLNKVNGDKTVFVFGNGVSNGDTIYINVNKLDTSYFSSSATADTIIGIKGSTRFVIGIIYTHDGLINGGVVTYSGTGLTYDVTAATYRKNAVIYNAPATSLTLAAADPTYDRIDLIVADTTGNIVVVPGTASADPVTPQIDPTYGIVLTTITVKAGTTTPADVTTLTIYDENTEWATSSVNLTVNYDNTINPFHLTKAADITAASNGGYMLFTNTSVISSANYSTLKFYIRLKTSLNSKSNINVQFFNGSTAVSNLFTLSSTYLNKTTTGTYQNISIPLTAFTFTNSSFDRIRISFSGTAFSAFYMDYATLQAGVSNGGGGTQDLNFVRNVFMSGDTLKETLNGVNQTITRVATPASVSDSIAAIHKDTLFLDGKPNYMDHDTMKTHIDSMPLLTYYNVFTNQYTANSLVTKHYVDSTTGAAGGGTVTSFSKTDGFGIISSVTNPTTTPNYSARVDTSVIHSTAYNNTLYGSLSQQNTNTSNIATKQATLVSGTNIKTINGASILGSGDLTISGSGIYAGTGTAFTSYASGDLIYASAANTLSKLAAGTNGYVLTLASGVPTWAASTGGGWGLNGNSVVDSNFIGTTNNKDLIFKTNNVTELRLTAAGVLQFANTIPAVKEYWYNAGAGARIGVGQLGGNIQFFGLSGGYQFTWNGGGDLNTTAGTNEWMRINGSTGLTVAGNITAGGNLAVSGTFTVGTIGAGPATNLVKQYYYDAGAGGRYGIGMTNNHPYLQSFVQTNSSDLAGWSWNIGGDLQTAGTNEVMRLEQNHGLVVAGGLSLGDNTRAVASAIADFKSTTKGVLPPRMTSTQRDAIASPATGLTLFCTDCTATDSSTGVTQTYNGSTWKNAW